MNKAFVRALALVVIVKICADSPRILLAAPANPVAAGLSLGVCLFSISFSTAFDSGHGPVGIPMFRAQKATTPFANGPSWRARAIQCATTCIVNMRRSARRSTIR